MDMKNLMDDEQKKKYIACFFLDLVVNKKINSIDNRFELFIDLIINDNPFLNIKDNIPFIITDTNSAGKKIDDTDLAWYDSALNLITINKNYLNQVFTDGKRFTKFSNIIRTLLHEREHKIQFDLINEKQINNLSNEQRDERKILFNGLHNLRVNPQTYADMMSIMADFGDSEYLKEFKNSTHKEKMETAIQINHGQYLERKIEERARENSITKLGLFFEEMSNYDLFDKEMQKLLKDNAKKLIEIFREEEDLRKQQQYPYYDKFVNDILKILPKNIKEIEEIMIDGVNQQSDELLDFYIEYAMQLFDQMSQNTAYYTFFEAMQRGLPIVARLSKNRILDKKIQKHNNDLKNNKGIDIYEKLNENVKKILMSDDIDKNPFLIDYSSILRENDISVILEKLIKEEKIDLAFNFIANGCSETVFYSKKLQQKLFDLLTSYKNNLINKIVKTDKPIVSKDIEIMQKLLKGLKTRNQDFKESKKINNKISDLILSNKSKKQSDDDELEAIITIYGVAYLFDLLKRNKIDIEKEKLENLLKKHNIKLSKENRTKYFGEEQEKQ